MIIFKERQPRDKNTAIIASKIMPISTAVLIFFHSYGRGHREKRLSYFPLLGLKTPLSFPEVFFFFFLQNHKSMFIFST